MTEQTARDRVWKFGFQSAVKNGNRITPEKIAEIADVSERMARDCLLVMADIGLLQRETKKDGSVYYEGCPLIDIDQERWDEYMGYETVEVAKDG